MRLIYLLIITLILFLQFNCSSPSSNILNKDFSELKMKSDKKSYPVEMLLYKNVYYATDKTGRFYPNLEKYDGKGVTLNWPIEKGSFYNIIQLSNFKLNGFTYSPR